MRISRYTDYGSFVRSVLSSVSGVLIRAIPISRESGLEDSRLPPSHVHPDTRGRNDHEHGEPALRNFKFAIDERSLQADSHWVVV